MEPTAIGPNRTGASRAPEGLKLMLEAVSEFSPPMPISTLQLDIERQAYISDAESVGSLSPTATQSVAVEVLLDKLGERLAFERTGTRLYDALITKYLALMNAGDVAAESGDGSAAVEEGAGETAEGPFGLETLRNIRAEELAHFQLLCQCVESLGGDPTAQTPSADVGGAAASGFMQTITDPRTTLAQCLNTILMVELADNAGWELLTELAEKAGYAEMAEQFSEPQESETEHLAIIRIWLESLLTSDTRSAAV